MADEKITLPDEEYIQKLKELVSQTQFGSISLIIQDGKVIQINRTEKTRL